MNEAEKHAEYLRKLDRHSFESRYDPLRDAVRRAIAVWHQEDEQEKNDLSEEFWTAMSGLEMALRSVMRGGEGYDVDVTGLKEVIEDVPEVEVTQTMSPVHVEAPERPLERRRSGAKNVSDPIYQNAFIEESRAAMGQPSKQDAEALLGYTVTLSFNVDWRPVTGVLTDVVDHPAGAPYLLLDNYRERSYPLNAIQQIVKVR